MVKQQIIVSEDPFTGQFVEQFEDGRVESIAYLEGKAGEGTP